MRKVNTLIATGIALAGFASASMALAFTSDDGRAGQSDAMMQAMQTSNGEPSASSNNDHGQMMKTGNMMHNGNMMSQMNEMMANCNQMMRDIQQDRVDKQQS